MNQLLKLAELFSQYKLYPIQCFDNTSIAHIFQTTHPKDSYAKDLTKILEIQHYKPEQRGADLPWWGKRFFSKSIKPRVMIISQDSNSPNAGSIVFHACLWPYMDYNEYKKYIRNNRLVLYRGFGLSRDLIQVIGFDNIYITDARKVYKKVPIKDKDFDEDYSKELLEWEISICDPELIVLLGEKTMHFMDFEERYNEVCGNQVLTRNNRPYIVAPFPSGANLSYNTRAEITKMFIRQILDRMT